MNVAPSTASARFAVIIVNYNGGAMLAACVRSALMEGVPQAQVAVIDNGSADESIANLLEEFANVELIRNGCNAGFARAVNQGLRLVTAEFALLLNNDAELEPGALAAFAAAFDANPNLAIAGGQLRYPDGRLQSAFAPFPSVAQEILPRALLTLLWPDRYRRKASGAAAPIASAEGTTPNRVEAVLGACLCVRASLLPTVGLLDEDYFFYFEEIEWCQRATRAGHDVYFIPAARAVHGHGQTANRFRGPSRVEYQRALLTFFRKTRSRPAAIAVSIAIVLRTLVNALSGLVACLATLFLNRRIRVRAATNGYLLAWNLLLRPDHWGLPGKCR